MNGGAPGFTPMQARSTGVRFQNDVSDSVLLGNRILGQGAGVALGDVDGDGRVDVFLARTEGCSALYRNEGAWKFEDVTRVAGVGACGRHASGAAFADIDGDRDLDLVLLATTGPNAIFTNDGRGRFTERRDLGLDSTGRGGTTITMADVDGDGRLDLYVANYKAYSPVDTLSPQQRATSQLVRQTGPDRYEVMPERANDFKLVMRPDMGGMNVTMRAEPDDFYRNVGGRFAREPLTSARFRDAAGNPLASEPESFGLGAKFVDLNGDGAPDLYVANDFEDTDELWWNDGRGNFRLADWTAQRQISNSAMGVDVADVNGDGLPDMFEVDMLSNDSRRLKTQMPTHTALPKQPGDLTTQLQQQRNTLFVNRGDGTFAEVAQMAGVGASGWSWGAMFIDVDLDGWQDILIANGHLWDIMDADVQERIQNRLTNVSWQRERWEFPTLKLTNVAFRNRGAPSPGGAPTFEDVSATWQFGVDGDYSHGLAAADLDGDGDQDVVVNRLRAPALLLRNDARAPRVAVRLIGAGQNTRAVGATVRLLNGATPVQSREVTVGGLYLSHSDFGLSFAAGRSDSATLVVDWRGGGRTTIHGVRPNREYEITEPRGGAPAASAAAASTVAAPPSSRGAAALCGRASCPLFEDATALLGGHLHTEAPFDDWERQFLLPNALSQLGPGVSWIDYDRDGDDDLIVGAGRGGSLGVFRNEGGRLIAVAGPTMIADATTVLGLPSPTGTRLVVGVSSWEVESAPSAAVLSPGRGAALVPLLPPQSAASGPLALGDYDGDGDLDLFVGGRAVPGAYPAAASSSLWRNEAAPGAPQQRQFVRDSARSAALADIGLVSAASFADVDGDGRADLVLAREWDAIALLLNRDDRFELAPASWGLARWTGRWNGVATGDLDGDGRLDLVATGWGRNTMTPTDSARPLVLFHGRFGAGGEEEMLLAREDARVRGLAPLNGYPRMRVAVPALAQRVGTFAAYADATVDQLLGPLMNTTSRRSIVTLDHMVFLNRGDHFEATALPGVAQEAPAWGAAVADFDGDGREDVFLSQNFYPTAVGLPRYDAGRGLLLSADERGQLQPVSGMASGIVVYGDQRGAAVADYDGDGRVDLVIGENAGATRLFHNRGAKVGLRVRLQGPPFNPDAVGAQVRLVYGGGGVGERMGPVREVQAGSGYWSQHSAVQLFGLAAAPTAVWVRWPGGVVTRAAVPPGARQITVSANPRG